MVGVSVFSVVSGFRRTLVRLKLNPWSKDGAGNRFQTNSREVEAGRLPVVTPNSAGFRRTLVRLKLPLPESVGPTKKFQTNSREVEAPHHPRHGTPEAVSDELS